MSNKIIWLRISCWAGAVVDGLSLVPMLFPNVARIMFGLPELNASLEYLYAVRLGAALMLGWTCLLLWADQKPLERKDILLLTMFPVLTGLIITELVTAASGFLAIINLLPLLLLQTVLFGLFLFSYLNAIRKN